MIVINKLVTFSGSQLVNMEVEPPKFIVSEIMPTGLHMLAGSPNIGKSWFVLWLCDQVAKGEKIWQYDTLKSEVLYLALEDTKDRLHHRLSSITDCGSDNVSVAFKSCNLEAGLIEQLEEYMKEKPNTNLIVIDTFQLIRNGSENIGYASDYAETFQLKEFAYKNKIAIVIVHHLRKMQDSDPLNMISGSTGMTGVVDNLYVLSKEKRTNNKAKLLITGRDVPDKELELKFNRDTHIWEFVKDLSDEEDDTSLLLVTIETLISEFGEFVGTATDLLVRLNEINSLINYPTNQITSILDRNTLALENSYNVKYGRKRTNRARLIHLQRLDESDGVKLRAV